MNETRVRDDAPPVSGRDFYDRLYHRGLELEAEWLDRSARQKAQAIETLLDRTGVRPDSIAELGCGTGAVIRELHRRNVARRYVAMDYSAPALDHLREKDSGIEVRQCDIMQIEPAREQFDVVVLSHVLEHLEDPLALLKKIRQVLNFRLLIAEVPLEALPLCRLKLHILGRERDNTGHVQFYTPQTFERLIESSGLQIIERHAYVPLFDQDTIRFIARKEGYGRAAYIRKTLTGRILPRILKPVWLRYYYGHHAVACRG